MLSLVFLCVCVYACVQVEGPRNKVILVREALSKLSKQQYSIEELTSKPLPEGVDPLRLEDYLSDQDFKVHSTSSKRTRTSRITRMEHPDRENAGKVEIE